MCSILYATPKEYPTLTEQREPTRDGVLAAARSIAAILPPAPLLPVEIGGVMAHVKAESLQPVGAFKIRGGWWRLSNLTEEERARGVVAVSSGNHAQAVAWAARRLGIAATIVMPRNAPKVKLEATRALGAEVVLYERPGEDRDEVAAKLVAERGSVLVHAFGDPWVIEGQGSAGVEIEAQLGHASRKAGTWSDARWQQARSCGPDRTRPPRSAMHCSPMRPSRSTSPCCKAAPSPALPSPTRKCAQHSASPLPSST